MKKILCIYHSRDLDGWMSGAIVQKWFKQKYPKAMSISDLIRDSHQLLPPDEVSTSTGEELDLVGWDYGDVIPKLVGYDMVIMSDISFPESIMLQLQEQYESDFWWFDHHTSAIDNPELKGKITGLQDVKFSGCELTWKGLFPDETMPEIVELLGLYDSLRYKGTDQEDYVMEFQFGARQHIASVQGAYLTLCDKEPECLVSHIHSVGEAVYGYLCTEAKAIFATNHPIGLHEQVKVGVGAFRKFACTNRMRFNPANFGIDYHSLGFQGVACYHYQNGAWNFSLYNEDGTVDCSSIAKGFGGGGHKEAAGFIVKDSDLFNSIIKHYG